MKMSKLSNLCIQYCRRFAANWDYFTIAQDSFHLGFKAAKEMSNLPELGKEQVDSTLDFSEGQNQLSQMSFKRWAKENYNLPLKEAMKTYLFMFNFKDIRVTEDTDGNISFQGTCKRNDLDLLNGMVQD